MSRKPARRKLTAENFRVEMARHRLSREEVCTPISMHVNELSLYLNGQRELVSWARHNIGWAINTVLGEEVFPVDMDAGPIIPRRGRPPLAGLPPTRLSRLRGKTRAVGGGGREKTPA